MFLLVAVVAKLSKRRGLEMVRALHRLQVALGIRHIWLLTVLEGSDFGYYLATNNLAYYCIHDTPRI